MVAFKGIPQKVNFKAYIIASFLFIDAIGYR